MSLSIEKKLYIPDSSVLVDGTLREAIKEGRISGDILIHMYLVRHFRQLMAEGRGEGDIGLREIELIGKICKKMGLEVIFTHELPEGFRSVREVEDTDLMLCELAKELNGILVTSSSIQYKTANALGVNVLYLRKSTGREYTFEKFFDENTMSIHLKEGCPPYAKKGRPGAWHFVMLRKEPMGRAELEQIVREIVEACNTRSDAYVDYEGSHSRLIQLGSYRIVITKPPLSDGLELTIVRPIVKLKLEDYNLPEKLIRRLEERAEGILIAGAPGMGKTTFAQALAEYYLRRGKIIKTIESPRDLQLPPEVTQYSKARATPGELHNILLLSRPDYTVFDEMRTAEDFKLYTDLRLAGVGMIGVVHATTPIDAIQRFIGKVELGMIPSIIDTVIFLKNGVVDKVYELEMVVKIPYGLREADLARPVVMVRDFLTGEPEYEIYVFGERTFVVPIRKPKSHIELRAKIALEKFLKRYIRSEDLEIEVTRDGRALVRMPSEYIPLITGKYRKRLEKIGRRLGLEIEIIPKA